MQRQTPAHPKGLLFCSMTELWERLGFYIVQASLVIYLVKQLGFSDERAYAFFTAVAVLLYAGPIIGGIIADKCLNVSRAIIFGIILFAVGYFLLTIHTHAAFYLAFAALIGGNSFLKVNISTLVGTLYDDNDMRRDSGFTWFYFGMNIGQFVGPIAASVAIKYDSFDLAFLIAGVSLIICLVAFYLGQKHFKSKYRINTAESNISRLSARNSIYLLTIVVLICLSLVLRHSNIVNICMVVFSILAFLYLLYCAFTAGTAKEKYKLLVLIILFVFSSMYWALLMQIFTSFTLFASRNVDRMIFGWTMPPEMLSSFEGLGVIIFAPLLANLWIKLGRGKYQPSFSLKFAYGFLFTAFCYGTVVLALHFFENNYMISVGWLVLSIILLAIGELCLSAIGMSAVTVLAPKKMVSTMMGFWYITIAIGLAIANKLADISAVPKHVSLAVSSNIYRGAFTDFMLISLVLFVGLVIITPLMKRLSCQHGV